MPPVLINRTPIHDDDHSGTTGTSLDNAWKQEFYDQIDQAFAALVEPFEPNRSSDSE